MKKQLSHAERETAFTNLFGSVRADSGGTGMGNNDDERDATLHRLSFDRLPDHVVTCDLPDPNPSSLKTTQSLDHEVNEATKGNFRKIFRRRNH